MVSIKEEEEEADDELHQSQHKPSNSLEELQMESESSPLRSPHQLKPPPPPQQQQHDNLSQIIAKDRRIHGFSPLRSPLNRIQQPPLQLADLPLSPVIVTNRSIREELSAVSKTDPLENGFSDRRRGADVVEDGGADRKRSSRAVSSVQWREIMVNKAALGFRVCGFVFCLISFSVMAADKTQGWAGDSFERYKEYRYCLSITVIAFAYAGFHALDLAYCLVTGIHFVETNIRYYLDFSMDQILTYLLISASSAAASRIDDWVSNWGKDDFTVMASAAVGMSFLAFVAFAFSSLISGYNLCTHTTPDSVH